MGHHVPSIPAGCPGCCPSCGGPSSLAGDVGVVGNHWWGSCRGNGCPVVGSGAGLEGGGGGGGLLVMGSAGPSRGFFSIAVYRSVGLLVAALAVAAAPLLLPKEARHVSVCVADQDAGPSWC